MGGSSSTSSTSNCSAANLETQLVSAKGSSRNQLFQQLITKYKNIDEENFYAMFGLALYSEMTPANEEQLGKTFRQHLLTWHPDKNHSSKKEECELMVGKLVLGRRVLTEPDLKRRYDLELRASKGESSTFGWYAAWGWNVAMVAGGLGLIIAGATSAAFTAGATTSVMVAGNAMLMSGVQTSSKMYRDPNCTTTEFIKDVVVGGAAGAAAGGLGVGGAALMQGASTATCVGVAAGVGALGYAANHVANDSADLAISNGYLGKHMKDNVHDSKTTDEVFSRDNVKMFLTGCAIGAVVGGIAQGAACAAAADDVSVAATKGAQQWRATTGRAAIQSGARRSAAIVASVANDAAAVAANQAATAVVHGGTAVCSTIRDADEESRMAIFDLAMAARDAMRAGDMESATSHIQEMNKKCMAALRLDDSQNTRFKDFLRSEDVTTFQQAQQWVANNIMFDWKFSGEYRHASEILSDKQGVCMEYSTLTCALANLVAPGRCQVVIGLMRARDPKSCHAWVEFDGVPYEPQMRGASRIDYSQDVEDKITVVKGETRMGGPYLPWFKYDTTRAEFVASRLNPDAAYEANAFEHKDHLTQADIYANFFITGGVNVNTEVSVNPVNVFVGHWEDDQRGLRISTDGSVHFEWSKVRDVGTFSASKGVIDENGLFTFTLSFPPDPGNPDGKAEWNLQPDGNVTIFFNHLMPNGEYFSKLHMRHRMPSQPPVVT